MIQDPPSPARVVHVLQERDELLDLLRAETVFVVRSVELDEKRWLRRPVANLGSPPVLGVQIGALDCEHRASARGPVQDAAERRRVGGAEGSQVVADGGPSLTRPAIGA